jgi:hypothetical protein
MLSANDQDQVAKNRWTTKLGPIDWQVFFSRIETGKTLIELQLYMKLLQRRLPVNQYLKTSIEENRNCPNCDEIETIEHCFYQCETVQQFWNKFGILLSQHLSMEADEIPEMTRRNIIFCFPEFLDRLAPQERYIVFVCHSVALWAIWSSRNFEGEIWNSFQCRLEARIHLDRKKSDFDSTWASGDLVYSFKNGYLLQYS